MDYINSIAAKLRRMLNENLDEMQRNSAFRKLQAAETDFQSNDTGNLSVTNEMMQVINAQNILIMKLLQKQGLLYQELNRRFASSESGSNSNKPHPQRQTSTYKELNNLEQFSSSSNHEQEPTSRQNNVKIIQRSNNPLPDLKPPRKPRFDCEVQSSPEEPHEVSSHPAADRKKQTETKNMVKNFAKAIFSYIRKNRDRRLRVLHHSGLSEEEFMRVLQQHRGHVHSISELRALWVDADSPFHRCFRILSSEYLRKHCLERTFNSRVENYAIHLKYRQRLQEGLRNPQEFTVLKTN